MSATPPAAERGARNSALGPLPVLLPALLLAQFVPCTAHAYWLEIPGVFGINLNSSGAGTFGEITLANLELDYSIEAQRQFVNGEELDNASTVTPLPGEFPGARYTASVPNISELSVQVDTVLFGPLRDVSGPNGYMRQTVTITNSGTPVTVDSVSLYTPAFETSAGDFGGDETARADPATGVVYANDGATTRFAAAGTLSSDQFHMSYEVGEQFSLPTFAQDLLDDPGPKEATSNDLTEIAVGLWTAGMVATGQSATMEFAYLFAMDETAPPPSFPAPAPAPAAALFAAVPLLLWREQRRRRSSPTMA